MLRPLLVALLALSLPALAAAQAPPADAVPFSQTGTLDHPPTDELVWNISAGATLNTGNSQSFAGNAGTHFSIRRKAHAFVFDLLALEGLGRVPPVAGGPPMPGWTETVSNVIGTARYDYFLTPVDALFVALIGRHDRFAGLEARFEAQAGYLRTLFQEDKHKLWAEFGYDFTYDYFWPHPFYDATGARIAGDRYVHSLRAFVGYDNHINDALTFTTGFEVLFRPYSVAGQGSLADGTPAPGSDFQIRLAWVNELHVKIDTHFALGLLFTLRYDSVPPPGKENLDTITVLNLIYTLI